MAFKYTGKYRATDLVVDYTDNSGQSLDGFPATHVILNAFSDPVSGNNYPAITDDAQTGETKEFKFATMADAQYQERLNAFYSYVNSLYTNLDAEASVIAGKEPTGTNSTCLAKVSQEMEGGGSQNS